MNDKLIDNFNFYQPINSKIITLQIINSSPIVNHNTSTKSSCSSHVFTKFRITNSEFLRFVYFTNQFVLPKWKQIRATIIFLLVKNLEFGIWKFVKTCNEQLKCYEEKNVLLWFLLLMNEFNYYTLHTYMQKITTQIHTYTSDTI